MRQCFNEIRQINAWNGEICEQNGENEGKTGDFANILVLFYLNQTQSTLYQAHGNLCRLMNQTVKYIIFECRSTCQKFFCNRKQKSTALFHSLLFSFLLLFHFFCIIVVVHVPVPLLSVSGWALWWMHSNTCASVSRRAKRRKKRSFASDLKSYSETSEREKEIFVLRGKFSTKGFSIEKCHLKLNTHTCM